MMSSAHYRCTTVAQDSPCVGNPAHRIPSHWISYLQSGPICKMLCACAIGATAQCLYKTIVAQNIFASTALLGRRASGLQGFGLSSLSWTLSLTAPTTDLSSFLAFVSNIQPMVAEGIIEANGRISSRNPLTARVVLYRNPLSPKLVRSSDLAKRFGTCKHLWRLVWSSNMGVWSSDSGWKIWGEVYFFSVEAGLGTKDQGLGIGRLIFCI